MNASIAASILLVEDDLRLSELVSRYLENHGFRVETVAHGDQVLPRVQRDSPDLIILDLGLPGQDGFAICKQLRPAFSNPILILTARDNDIDQVLGLELGADDYVIKPVEPRVLMARIQALLRRSRAQRSAEHKILRFGRLHINTAARSVALDGRSIALSTTEFELLVYLLHHHGQVLSREQILSSVWGYEHDPATNVVDVYVGYLRRKLGRPEDPAPIFTVRAVGYRLGSVN